MAKLQVKAVGAVEQKSRQQIEEELIAKKEAQDAAKYAAVENKPEEATPEQGATEEPEQAPAAPEPAPLQ